MLHMPHGLAGHGLSKQLLALQAHQYQTLLLRSSMLEQDLARSDMASKLKRTLTASMAS